MKIFLDFETRSSFELLDLAAYIKACDLLVTAIKVDNFPTQSWMFKEAIPVLKKYAKFNKGVTFVCHNPQFDFLVFQKFTGVRNSYFKHFIGTELMSAYLGGPFKLEKAAEFFNLKQNKNPEGKELIKILCMPKSKSTPRTFRGKNIQWGINKYVEDEVCLRELRKYCVQDVEVTSALYNRLKWVLPEMDRYCIWQDYYLNFIRNIIGVRVDTSLIKGLDKVSTQLKKAVLNMFYSHTQSGINIFSPAQVDKYLTDLGFTSGGSQLWHLKQCKLQAKTPFTRKVLDLLIARPTNILHKLSCMVKRSAGVRPRLRFSFLFFGTGHTGRFTSFYENILNFPRNENNEELASDRRLMQNPQAFIKKYQGGTNARLRGHLRKTLVADEGHVFFGGDFKAIDFRFLLAASGELDMLKQLYHGFDFYTYIASEVWKTPANTITPFQRNIAKKAVLAFGYGMGLVKLLQLMQIEGHLTSKQYEIMPLVKYLHKVEDYDKLKVILNHSFREYVQIQLTYHQTLPRIRQFWETQEKTFDGNSLTVPYSGRQLHFYKTFRDSHGDMYYQGVRGAKKLWGGYMTAFVIQSLTSDFFRWSIRNMYHKLGLHVLIPFHDEIVVSVPPHFSFDLFKKTLTEVPDWLKPDFPFMECETWKNERYIK